MLCFCNIEIANVKGMESLGHCCLSHGLQTNKHINLTSTAIQFHLLPFIKFSLLKREWRPFFLRMLFEDRSGMFECTWGAITGIG